MNAFEQRRWLLDRRAFFRRSGAGLGLTALASLLNEQTAGAAGLPGLPHFAARAKRVIYLFQSGAPSQMDLFDYKPALDNRRAEELPDSIRKGQRLTGMTSRQASFPIAPSVFRRTIIPPLRALRSQGARTCGK